MIAPILLFLYAAVVFSAFVLFLDNPCVNFFPADLSHSLLRPVAFSIDMPSVTVSPHSFTNASDSVVKHQNNPIFWHIPVSFPLKNKIRLWGNLFAAQGRVRPGNVGISVNHFIYVPWHVGQSLQTAREGAQQGLGPPLRSFTLECESIRDGAAAACLYSLYAKLMVHAHYCNSADLPMGPSLLKS